MRSLNKGLFNGLDKSIVPFLVTTLPRQGFRFNAGEKGKVRSINLVNGLVSRDTTRILR